MEVTTNPFNSSNSSFTKAPMGRVVIAGCIVQEIVAFTGIVSNILGILAMKMAHLDIRPVHYFLINLSLVDITICISIGGLLVHYLLPWSPVLYSITFVFQTAYTTTLLSQAGCLLILALDHYFAIVYPLRHYLILNKRCCCILITIQWSMAIAINSASVACVLRTPPEEGPYEIGDKCKVEMFLYFLYFGLVILGMTIIYIRVLFEIRRMTNRNLSGANISGHNKKAIKTTFVILGTYVVAMSPQIVAFLISHNADPELQIGLYIFLNCWLLLNCICDPLVYSLRMRNVREGYLKMFEGCKCHARIRR